MNLESLERVLTAYKSNLYDLADQIALQRGEERKAAPSDEGLIRSLAEAIRRVEGWRADTETRLERLERRGDDGSAV